MREARQHQKDVAQKVRTLRETRGLTEQELVLKLVHTGMTQVDLEWVQLLEQGDQPLNGSILYALALAFDVLPAHFERGNG